MLRPASTRWFEVLCARADAVRAVAALAPLVLRHRLIRTFQADAEGKTTDEIIAQLLHDVPRE